MIGILGGGLSGVALAAYLRQPSVVIEAEAELGGLCRTVTTPDGYSYDLGPHILFSRDPELLDEMTGVLGDNWHERPRENRILLDGRLVGWPLENHLGDLPPEVRARCLRDYVDHATRDPTGPTDDLDQWCRAAFGDALAEAYLLPYNRKLWKRAPAELASDWCGRLPRPALDEVIGGACGVPSVGHAHQATFRYPKRGGIAALVEAYRARGGDRVDVREDERVRTIDGALGAWRVVTTLGEIDCEQLVSTIPLRAVVNALTDVPGVVAEAVARLEWLDLVVTLPMADAQAGTAVYVPDPGVPWHRTYYPRAFSEASGPGRFSCSEVTVPRGAESRLAGARVPYAYPVPTLATAEARRLVLDYLSELGIRCVGRAGTHSYLNMDHCVRDARALARELDA